MEHILIPAQTTHQLRIVTCLSAGGNIGCSILRTDIAAGVMAEKVRNRPRPGTSLSGPGGEGVAKRIARRPT